VFPRGFKSWCETVSVQRRKALELKPVDPLRPDRLAASLGVATHGVEDVPGLDADSRNVLLGTGADSWSAVTITDGTQSVIVLNSAHSKARSASDLMHELSHLIVGHKPTQVVVSEDGALLLNTYDKQQEDEANWLSGCLLLPRPALLWMKKRRMTRDGAASHFGVSLQMLTYRIQVTGIEHQLKRAAAFMR